MSSAEALLKNLPIEILQASSTNPRQHFDRAGLDELKASIAESGIQQPLLVRPVFLEDWDGGHGVDVYEVVAGERRLRAAQELGLADLPCLVREMTDEEAREVQIIENLQRAGVAPLEEAQAFGELLDRLGSIPAVAAKLGKEQSYVAKCLRLRSLTLCSADALRGRLITIEHALLLARLAEVEQNAALKWTLDRNAGSTVKVEKVVDERLAQLRQYADDDSKPWRHWVWEPESVAKLKSHIESEGGVKLSRAPWSLTEEDYLLPDVGPCAECPSNTTANTPLFGDLEMGEPTCTDGACFAAKTQGFVQIEQRKAGHDEQAKPKALVPQLSWKSSSVKPSIVSNLEVPLSPTQWAEMANPAKLLKQGQWVEAKTGSCTNVRPGVTADWSDAGQRGYMGREEKLRKPGETLQVCIAVGCKVHRKDWEKPKSANGNQAERRDPEEEKRQREQGEYLAKVEPKIRAKVLNAILGQLDAARAIRLVSDNQDGAAAVRKEILTAFPGVGGEHLEALTLFYFEFRRYLHASAYHLMQAGGIAQARKELWALAKQVGVNADQVAAKHFHDAGSIAPAADKLYPKGVPWPKDAGAAAAPAKATKKAAKKVPAKKVNKHAVKPAARPARRTLTAEGRKRITDAMKKLWAERQKAAKKGAKA